MRRGPVVVALLVGAGCAAPRTDLTCPDTLEVGETGTASASFQEPPDGISWTIPAGDGAVVRDRAGDTELGIEETAQVTPDGGPRLVLELRATWIRYRRFDGDVGYAVHAERECRITVPVPDPPPTPPTTSAPPTTTDPSGADRVLFDDVAADANWSATVSNEHGGATYDPGHPMVHHLPAASAAGDPTFITVEHVFQGGGWDPAVDGPLASVTYSVTRRQIDPPFPGAAIGDAFAIWQDGQRFVHFLDEGGSFANTTPETTTTGALTPADFEPARGLDFGAGGAPLTFGFVRSNTNESANEIVTRHTATDWTVELVRE